MADTYITQVRVCMCCLQASAYAEPCGCEDHETLTELSEGEYLTMGNGNSEWYPWDACYGCGTQGADLYPMGLWRLTA